MRRRAPVFAAALITFLWPAAPALARPITVPETRLDLITRARTVNELAPDPCASLDLENLVTVKGSGGTASGTDTNDLILGGPNGDRIRGRRGNDCIVAGDGDDIIDGGGGNDVCIGGAGFDVFVRCPTAIQ